MKVAIEIAFRVLDEVKETSRGLKKILNQRNDFALIK